MEGNSIGCAPTRSFVGIRYGNLWDRDLSADWRKPEFFSDLRKLASAGLELDSANPDPKLIRAILEVSQQIPELSIVIDHLPAAAVPTESVAGKEYWANLRSLSQNARVFVKLSEVPVRVANSVPKDVSFYKNKLDRIWEVFGEDHVLFGSDWPNSDHLASIQKLWIWFGATYRRKVPLPYRSISGETRSWRIGGVLEIQISPFERV